MNYAIYSTFQLEAVFLADASSIFVLSFVIQTYVSNFGLETKQVLVIRTISRTIS